jgi:uncharacterized protein YbaR (Trm112 family)
MAHLPARLLDVLRCPVTRSALIQDGEILRSRADGPHGAPLTYALEEGIPVLLRDELLEGTRRHP